jgi:hypothetical protein
MFPDPVILEHAPARSLLCPEGQGGYFSAAQSVSTVFT